MSDAIQKMFKARAAIVDAIKNGAAKHGQIPCPICSDGALLYGQAHNGHIHARCTTPNCTAWME